MTNQSDKQQSVRDTTGTVFDYNGDWHALFDAAFIPTGSFNGRLLQWINAQLSSSYTEINGAMAAYATSQGVSDWNSLNTATPPFTPTNISGLALWLDAADTTTITHSGGSVSQWDDKSGNNYHATQTLGAVQPITGTRTINGRNVLDFVAGLSYMSLPSGMLSFGVNDWTHIVVLATDTTATAQRVISGIGTGAALTHGVFYNTANIANARQGVGVSASSSGGLNTNVNVLAGRRSGSTLQTYLNGNELSGSNSSAVNDTLTSFTIGSTATTMDGRIAEILSYSRSISDSEYNDIGNNHIAPKWGITWINI